MTKPETEWKRLNECHRTIWTQDQEHGERSCITEYRHQLGFEEGTRQNCLVSSCIHGHSDTLWHGISNDDDDDDIYNNEYRLK